MDREHVIAKLRAHERQLKDDGIKRLSLFGSTARGDAGPGSDVGLLAAFDETRRISLLDIVGMELDLSEMLGGKVDLIEEGTLKPRVQRSAEAEVVRAFSRPGTAFAGRSRQHRPHRETHGGDYGGSRV